jgi:hypothetical protein
MGLGVFIDRLIDVDQLTGRFPYGEIGSNVFVVGNNSSFKKPVPTVQVVPDVQTVRIPELLPLDPFRLQPFERLELLERLEPDSRKLLHSP